MKSILYVLTLLIFSASARGQQLFQDGSGKSNIYFGETNRGWLTYNSSDKSGTVGYTRSHIGTGYEWRGAELDYIYGGDLKINVKNGVGNVIAGGSFKPGITAEGFWGVASDHFLKYHMLFIYASPALSYTEYDLISEGSTTLQKVNKWEGRVLINFNSQFFLEKSATVRRFLFVGLQTGYSRINNYSDLKDAQINTLVAGDTLVGTYTSETGKLGSYKKYDVIPINVDIGFTPRIFKHNYFGFNTYLRTNVLKEKNDTKIGIGVYLADEKKPSNITGGLAWQFNDVSNVLNKEGSAFSRSSLFFYVGFAIGAK